jgi:hypothetical protein
MVKPIVDWNRFYESNKYDTAPTEAIIQEIPDPFHNTIQNEEGVPEVNDFLELSNEIVVARKFSLSPLLRKSCRGLNIRIRLPRTVWFFRPQYILANARAAGARRVNFNATAPLHIHSIARYSPSLTQRYRLVRILLQTRPLVGQQ